jgi:hypothetical protein
MWLLDVSTYKLHEFQGSKISECKYAILSHTWGNDEVTFRDLDERPQEAACKAAFGKIKSCCARAKADGWEWVWVDSCCIDKRSSAELSEAINSMFKWYKESAVCYVYFADVSEQGMCGSHTADTEFAKSRWFTRGWTLQELLAPTKMVFFSNTWTRLADIGMGGGDQEILQKLSDITNIGGNVISGAKDPKQVTTSSRISWVAKRHTTRAEDLAYCLMGLFDVHMPILYGEGLEKAFKRLQWEIIKRSPDETIFAWCANKSTSGFLASSPADFSGSCKVSQREVQDDMAVRDFAMTNIGMAIETVLIKPPASCLGDIPGPHDRLAIMPIGAGVYHGGENNSLYRIGLFMRWELHNTIQKRRIYRRVNCGHFYLRPDEDFIQPGGPIRIYVPDDDNLYEMWEGHRKGRSLTLQPNPTVL